ncbi:Alkaline shock protein [Candidatus Arthromitus sp. SFB-mouse-NL]|uniref:Asp23/Gls24 family envelope stress response protein n=1 Tax=Candidatus Arthromitus sp. SFB-mouse-NL TaxID=1508644 RepID=UPI00049A86F6|nr:Asp23/Gls24 family envelope stress response protein [Candidatus Arthromitus sp. SFB-mouse-NL]AID44947.1 Alkaline shock protein [Candidatus Arthromitus sp. SFB-mouse-NL]
MNNSIGVVKISDDVITVIAGIAASEIKGVYPLFNNNSNGNNSFNKKNISKGIKVNLSDNKTSIDISVAVEYGIKIPSVIRELQENVKTQVETFTGVKMEEINVFVQRVLNKSE